MRLLLRSLAVSLAIALLLIILQTPLQQIMFALIQPTADIAPLSSTYYYIVIWGAPAMLGLYGLTGWYIGMQNTRIPMLVSIIQNITNIIASLTLVAGLGMGFRGVAFGTVISPVVEHAVGTQTSLHVKPFCGSPCVLHKRSRRRLGVVSLAHGSGMALEIGRAHV